MSSLIHPTAIIDPGAKLGHNVSVGPYAIIEDTVVIGDDCRIDGHAIIKRFTTMGAGNRVHSHALVGGEPQDLKFSGEETELILGDNNQIREFATLHRGTEGGGGYTRIGSNNLLMAYVHVAHDCTVGNNVVMSNSATLAGHVQVGDYAILGGLSAVHQFCRIGSHAFVGGMTGIGQDLPPWMLASASRGVFGVVHGPNMVGLRRAGVDREVVTALKAAFRLVWRTEMSRSEALEALVNEYGNLQEVMMFVDFIRLSERGLCSGEKMPTKA